MNVTELARRLRLSVELTRRIIPRVGFDIGFKAIKVEDKIAEQIIERVQKAPDLVEEVKQELMAPAALKTQATGSTVKRTLRIPESLSVRELAQLLQLPVTKIVTELMKNGIFATLNEEIDFTTASIIAEDLGYTAVKPEAEQKEIAKRSDVASMLGEEKNRQPRPPVIVIMGHVDHGKTSLLDAIRKSHIIEGEAGGITQHIGSYQIEHKGRKITFIDTPGHEAFTAMRSRGATVADIAILIIAWDEGIKPQTIEAINIIKKMELPFIVCITKMDKPESSDDKVLKQLAEQNLLPEQWGGQVTTIGVSAKTGKNLDGLLNLLLLQNDMLQDKIQADPNGPGAGTVIESHMDKGEGPVATVITQTGTLHTGDLVTCGNVAGKIKALKDDLGHSIQKATPGTPVKILGLKELPQVGDIIQATEDKKALKKMMKTQNLRANQIKERQTRIVQQVGVKDIKKDSTFRIVLKTDNAGSLEAITESIEKLPQNEVKVVLVKKSVGPVSESDITEAAGTGSVIYAFHTETQVTQKRIADQEHVEIREFDIIYKLMEDLISELESRLKPEVLRTTYGAMTVKAIFRGKGSLQVVGGAVTSGKIKSPCMVDLFRNTILKGSGKLAEIRIGARTLQEAQLGSECGVKLDHVPHVEIGDKLEFYSETTRAKKLIA